MKVEIVMPQMGESIAEATILKWLKRPGDHVAKDEIILEISTDKVDSEIPASEGGLLYDVFFDAGEVVPVKTPIAVIETDESCADALPEEAGQDAEIEPLQFERTAAAPPRQSAFAPEQPAPAHNFSNRF